MQSMGALAYQEQAALGGLNKLSGDFQLDQHPKYKDDPMSVTQSIKF